MADEIDPEGDGPRAVEAALKGIALLQSMIDWAPVDLPEETSHGVHARLVEARERFMVTEVMDSEIPGFAETMLRVISLTDEPEFDSYLYPVA